MRIVWLLVIALAGAIAGYVLTRFEGTAPFVQTRLGQIYIGRAHTHEVRVSDDGTGVESVRIWLEAGDQTHELTEERFAGNILTGAQRNLERSIDVALNPRELGLPDGRAFLHIEAHDWSWRGNRTHVRVPLLIDTHAPRIALRTGLTYVRRGGAEVVVYRLDEEVQRHGVELGGLFFPGYVHPADPDQRVAFYALPPDMVPGERPRLIALDRSGNQASVELPVEVTERGFPQDEIQLSEGFMQRKVAELVGDGGEELLSAYLRINGEMRVENAERIRELCQSSSEDRLWNGAFLQLPGSHVGARYAERRTYSYAGQTVDHQVHLGYDLASVAHAPVPAANDGVVVFADAIGIYGNTVILDHGLGLFTLYGHLSEIAVGKGSAVARGEELGRTGQTGLAGGDHLHFAVLVSGTFVDPLEWFDERWIREHIEPKLSSTGFAEL